MKMTTPRVQKLALTGGPGGGKTKLAKFITRKAKKAGMRIEVVPEAATLLMNSGISPHGGEEQLLNFQRAVLRETILREQLSDEVLQGSGGSQLLRGSDRGKADIRAYVSEEQYRMLLTEQGIAHPVYARDRDYDAVIHMRTAALGAEEHYSNKSNKQRSEDPALARERDQRTLEAWLGHQHLAIIGNNYGSFRGKLEAGWRAARRLLGIPRPLEIEKRYVVDPVNFASLSIPHAVIDVEQHYLLLPSKEGSTCRVRSWGQEGHATYTLTEKRHIAPGVVEELEEQISEMAFAQFTKYADPQRAPLTKRRTCFVYNDQYFMYDEFLSGQPGLTMLEIELESQKSPVDLPPFLTVRADVTHDRAYSSSAIAKIV